MIATRPSLAGVGMETTQETHIGNFSKNVSGGFDDDLPFHLVQPLLELFDRLTLFYFHLAHDQGLAPVDLFDHPMDHHACVRDFAILEGGERSLDGASAIERARQGRME